MSEADESNSEHRVSLSCKIPVDWNKEIERKSELSGVTKSQWLSTLVGETLGKFNDDFISLILEVLKNGNSEMKRQALKKLLIFVAHSI
jgi:hypothetical protein